MAKTANLQEVAIDLLVPYERNAKKHPDEQIEKLQASIREFGFVSPCLIDKDYNIIAGHGRVMAAKQMGLERVPCVLIEGLTEEQRRAYILADNRLTELGGWDMDAVKIELEDLALDDFDITLTGFDFDFADEDTEVIDDEYDADKEDIPTRTKLGDVYQLGEHRLLCGDSTNADDVANLMNGKRADVCITSPPYNMASAGDWKTAPREAMHSGKAYGTYSDNVTDDEYGQMLCDALGNALSYCDDVIFNIGILEGSKTGIVKMLDKYKTNFLDIVVWNKASSMPHGMESQRGMLSHRCELLFCFNQKGSRSFTHPQWEKGTGINRIDTPNASGNTYAKEHAATFPIEFAFECVKMFSSDSVVDLFGGTGTTIIAAEELGRACYMMELDPHYCDIIIDRWEQFTGRKAALVNG